MKLSKVALAIAGALAVVAGSAHAGQIDSSSTTLAREVIYSNDQLVRAPSKSYTFAGVIDARTNEQRLQLQWTLSNGLKWGRNGDVQYTGTGSSSNLSALPNGAGILNMNGKDLANADIGFNAGGLVGNLSGVQVSSFLTDGDSTLVFNITIPQDAANYVQNAVFQINAGDFTANNGGTGNTGITNALAVAGATACVADATAADITFKHFTSHNENNQVITGATPDSEHLRNGQNSSGRYINFTENLRFNFTAAASSQTDASTLRQTFLRSQAQAADLATAAASLNAPVGRIHRIGTVQLAKIAGGLDLNYANQYGNGANAVALEAADFTATLGVQNNGVIETPNGVSITVNAGASGFAAGSSVALLSSTDAVIPVVAGSGTFNASGVATLRVVDPTALARLASGPARLYYVVPGNSEIPQNPSFTTQATLTKSETGALREQPNTCSGTLAGVGGGIKIDVRNYAAYATFGNSGPATTVRVINNSETQTADVYAQIIYADGTYGAWGQLPTLKPREVANLSNQQIEALLTNAPAATNPFGSAAVGYQAKGGASVVGSSKAGISDRLRIVSNTGTTLRVQSYMVVGNSVIDTSNAQGVDFENSGDRVPTNAVDAQPVSQDAINGLGR